MKNLNNYISEAWSGVKKQSYEQEIKSWCDEIKIRDYTINDNGEIDVDGSVWLDKKDFKELPYKFGSVSDYFSLSGNTSLISLKNCPDFVGDSFACDFCSKLGSLEGCPRKVMGSFFCNGCKRKFTIEEIQKTL